MVAEFRKFNEVVKKRTPEFAEGAKMVESLLNELSERNIYPAKAEEVFSSRTHINKPIQRVEQEAEKTPVVTPEFINVSELALRLNVTRATVSRYIKEGLFKTYTNPYDYRQKLISVDDVARFEKLINKPPR